MKTNPDLLKSNLKILYMGRRNFDEMARLRAYPPFAELIVGFLNDLSSGIFQDAAYKQYPDVISFAFFIRRANLQKMRRELLTDDRLRLGRGLVFHVVPANVPVNFALSLVAGLLSGNPNIVKVSSADFPQIRLLCATCAALLNTEQYHELADYLAVVQYDNQREINDYFSSLGQTRIIWGGDQTIATIRKSPLPPRSVDLTFANRYSFCLINAAAYLNTADQKKIAADFYNDTYAFDQNACFSPRLVYWTGEPAETERARGAFWAHLHAFTREIYHSGDSIVSEKQMALCRTILSNEGIMVIKSADNLIVRCEAAELTEDIMETSSPGGFFIEYAARNLDGLAALSGKKIQTLSCYGYDPKELAQLIAERGFGGIDRVTAIGKANEFSLVWDGVNLITALTRIIDH